MFPRTRHTRSKSRKPLRKQHGGAVQSLAEFRFSDGSGRLQSWIDWQTTVSDTFPYFGKDGTVSFEQYMASIQHQDEIYKGAVSLIRKEIGIDAAQSEEDILAFYKTNGEFETWQTIIQNYLRDVIVLLTVNGVTTTSIPTEPLPFLLRPDVDNICIQSLANVFFLLQDDTTIQTIERFNDPTDTTIRDSLEVMLEKKYQSYSMGLALSVQQSELKGYFYPGQDSGSSKTDITFRSIFYDSSFWSRVITNIVAKTNAMNYNADNTQEQWAFLTVDLFRTYTEGTNPLTDILTKVVAQENRIRTTNAGKRNKPTWTNTLETNMNAYASRTIPGTSITLGAILEKISFERLQFVLHLMYTLEKTKPEWNAQKELLATLTA